MHLNDKISVNKWVEKCSNSEDSPILLYKDQNTINEALYPGMKKEDFLLVIMNSSQKEMVSYGNIICLDFTHGINSYGFHLATFFVLDDKREGFLAVFIISTCQDSVPLAIAFRAVKEQVEVNPEVLMSDDTESFYNTWKLVFGEPNKRLLCAWYDDCGWRRKIGKLNVPKEQQIEVYKVLRCLLCEIGAEAFEIMMSEAIGDFEENDLLKEFGMYFKEN
ncbi:MULE domain-containing protein [Caerostris darwini]|uniref:MULE domain-containing protein n=1 Tax=Caerostris darwini TaxID=1538125 RepID=A0AAV4PJE0_9ARAC|nr:MULE domain-containing protein [Caerostris darwini]